MRQSAEQREGEEVIEMNIMCDGRFCRILDQPQYRADQDAEDFDRLLDEIEELV